MRSAILVPHINHVGVSPTNGNGPTQGQGRTLTRVGIETTTFGLDHRVGSPSLCGPISISRANAHMVHTGYKASTSHYTVIS